MHVGIFDLGHVKVIWGHLVHFSENLPVTQKWLVVERNGRKFGPWGVYVACMLVFDLDVEVIWGHSVHFSKNWAITHKQLTDRAKRTKIWARRVYVICMLVLLTLNMSRSFGIIRCTFPKIGP